MNVLIIAGHGGTPYDPGATGCGQQEAVQTRVMAKLIYDEMRKVDGLRPVLYDTGNDAYKVLKNGGSLPLSGIGYVIECHLNACVKDTAGDGKTTGVEVLVHPTEKGVTVEQAICRRIAALGLKNRGVKPDGGLLVMNTVKRHGISHALIEFCFIDDRDDMNIFMAKREQIAKAVVAGVCEGFGIDYEEESEMSRQEIQKIVREEIKAYFDEQEGKSPSAWAEAAWKAAQDAGITDGTRPQAGMTREEGVVMLERCGLVGRKEA